MFQRLKGAIDSRIAEEQARQRSVLTSPPPSGPARKPSSRAESPAKQSLRPTASSRPNGAVSDPAEFEPEFVIDDSDVPSRSGTPRSAPARSESSIKEPAREVTEEARDGEETHGKAIQDGQSAAPSELPTDIRMKLRKLEKLEGRYHELLRSYKVAHARVQTIDSFEASLRENTPLTSISDPHALAEYLNQLNLKDDMVVDELKRVSHERDTYKQQLSDAQKQATEAWDEVANFHKEKQCDGRDGDQLRLDTAVSPGVPPIEQSKAEHSPSETVKSRTGSLPSLSTFSPKPKPAESPVIKESREDLFSYDDEIPRLQSELEDREEKIEELQSEVTRLKGDLAVTRESTQSMVQTLEEATRELNNLRDHRDRSATEFEEQREASRNLSDKLQGDLAATEAKLQEREATAKSEKTDRLLELEQQLIQANEELEYFRVKARKSDEQVSETRTLQQKVTSLENEVTEARAAKEQSEKKFDTAASLLKTIRQELAENKQEYTDIVNGKETLEETLRERIRSLENPENKQSSSDAIVEAGSRGGFPANALQAQNEAPGPATDAATTGKKKNKKKKKGARVAGEQNQEPQLPPSEPASIGTPKADQGVSEITESAMMLKGELEKCRQQLEEKDIALEKIRSKLKDQEDLKEEIESLRDDLINLGQEHVQAKDKAKELQAEKHALQDTVTSLEKDLAELQVKHDSNTASSNQEHQDLVVQFDDLKTKASALQTDLSAAQQVASSQFKELSDLRAMMQKVQPELNTLRSKVGELRSIKEAHDKKEADIKKLEARHEDMRTEIATLRRSLAERDAEIWNVNQKVIQESSSRSRAEDARNRAHEEVQRLEAEKRQATESLDKLSRDLGRARDEIANLKNKSKELEQQTTALKRDNEGLKDEIELKTVQHASAQSLMSSMRDQTTELAVQMKEARDRCDSLEEEVADAHRLLSERSREGETMRRLLADMEGKADARTREMKERMENAIEERDRAEDEASTAARRRARELDDLRNKVREAERSLKRAEDDKEELETAQREWKRRREELEHQSEQSTREAEEVRRAMGELRDALDESERQAREAEKQKVGLRKGLEETQHRLERLQKSNKSMADEIRTIQTAKNRGIDSEAHSSRSSTDSAPPRARLAGTSEAARPMTPSGQAMDFVYLKNVLLQFLEQKDKNHQKQLIPVLGMLLHFDR
ncbi:MAG: hypothetical protein LQ343_004710 [Gyalolechia ehrenbergii]|nr:MAG: hypothetical protein LQ343_004710 [Gyalolechia ehrenbergii]